MHEHHLIRSTRFLLAACSTAFLLSGCADMPVEASTAGREALQRAVLANGAVELYGDRSAFVAAIAGAPRISTYDFTTPAPVESPHPEYGRQVTLDDLTFRPAINYYNQLVYWFPNSMLRTILPPGTVAVGMDMARFYDVQGDFVVRLSTGEEYRYDSGPALPWQPPVFFGIRSGRPIEWIEMMHTGTYGIIDNLVVAVDPSSINRPPVAVPGADEGYAGVEGAAVQFDGGGSTDPEGGTLTYAWNFSGARDAGGALLTEATGPAPEHAFADDGAFTVTLTVTDPAGASHTASRPVTIQNAAPRILMVTGLATDPIALGEATMTVAASFADAGIHDTHQSPATTIEWGDGAVSSAANGLTLTEPTASAAGNIAATHTYAAPGVYTVTTTVTDDAGASDRSIHRYVVVYDASGGFVTGGGWITSPDGACTVCGETGADRASFGFVSRYLPGATAPSGSTEFTFRAGGFTFRSGSHDWLVVAGARAQFKGEGAVNGKAGYGFLLTAVDGSTSGGGGDRFRIKIWDRATGAVVYDNQRGAAEDAEATTALEGGSIVIHR